jgi:H+/Cl- antiporter ClcA
MLCSPIVFAALCGLLLAVVSFLSPGQVFYASYGQARGGLIGGVLPPPVFTPLTFLLTLVSYLYGIPGGVFAPSLAVASVGEPNSCISFRGCRSPRSRRSAGTIKEAD